jgi:hypothetical protein
VPLFKKQPTPFQRIVAIQFLRKLGPGLITGASDDDPSGIGTYSQAGAQLGYSIGWTMLLTYPLMVAIQEISARIGRTTGHGISGNLCRDGAVAGKARHCGGQASPNPKMAENPPFRLGNGTAQFPATPSTRNAPAATSGRLAGESPATGGSPTRGSGGDRRPRQRP